MLNKFFGFFILGLFSLLSASYILSPVFLGLEFLTFGFSFSFQNISNALLLAVFCGSILIVLSVCKNILFFYVSFFIRRKAKKFTDYRSTQYSKMIEILQEESFRQIPFSPMKIKILIDEDFKPNVYSFGSRNRGFIVFSLGMLEEIVRLIKEDSNKALDSFKSLIAHEIAHLKNYDFIIFDFYDSQAKLSSFLISLYTGILIVLQFLFTIIPIPFIRSWLKKLFDYILIIPTKLILNIPLFAFTKINSLLRSTLFQVNETMADIISVKLFGIKYFQLSLEKLPQFSSMFSLHKKTSAQRIAKVSKIERTRFQFDDDYKDIFILANLLIILMMSLIIAIVLFFLNMENVVLIQNHIIKTFMEFKYSEHKIILMLTNIKSLFF